MTEHRKAAYGQELILDLHGCDVGLFNRRELTRYFIRLCELVDMERCDLHFWDDEGVAEDEKQTSPQTKGTSAVQFILTSSVMIHTLDLLGSAYINIFSCKAFDDDVAADFTRGFFGGRIVGRHAIERK